VKRFLGLILFGLALCWAAPAAAVVGTPVNVAHATTTSALNSIGASSYTVAAGQAVIAIVNGASAMSGTPSCADGFNTFTATAMVSGGSAGKMFLCYCPNPVAVTAGTLTATWTGAVKAEIAIFQVPGLNLTAPLDVTAAVQSGTSAANTPISPAVSTPVAANEFVIAMTVTAGTASTFTDGAGVWNVLTGAGIGSSNNELHPSYQVTASTGAVTYAPSWVTSRVYMSDFWSFKAASGAPPANHNNLLLMGVGQ
jgi:hypothetical protein